MVTKLLFSFICVLLLAVGSSGRQANTYRSNGWQSLLLDRSTPEDAIRALGTPVGDKLDKLDIHNVDKWMTPKHKQKIFRKLTYKKAGEVKKAELAFLDNKLVSIRLEYNEKKFFAKDLEAKFELDFVLVEEGVPSDSTPSMYEGQKESLIPKVYPYVYYMVSVTPQSFISAQVLSGRTKAMFKEVFRVQTKEPFPGSLMNMEIISRSLAKHEPTPKQAAP